MEKQIKTHSKSYEIKRLDHLGIVAGVIFKNCRND